MLDLTQKYQKKFEQTLISIYTVSYSTYIADPIWISKFQARKYMEGLPLEGLPLEGLRHNVRKFVGNI